MQEGLLSLQRGAHRPMVTEIVRAVWCRLVLQSSLGALGQAGAWGVVRTVQPEVSFGSERVLFRTNVSWGGFTATYVVLCSGSCWFVVAKGRRN